MNSGLPADGTMAAAVIYTIGDLHRPGCVIDYPKGGGGAVIGAMVRTLACRVASCSRLSHGRVCVEKTARYSCHTLIQVVLIGRMYNVHIRSTLLPWCLLMTVGENRQRWKGTCWFSVCLGSNACIVQTLLLSDLPAKRKIRHAYWDAFRRSKASKGLAAESS